MNLSELIPGNPTSRRCVGSHAFGLIARLPQRHFSLTQANGHHVFRIEQLMTKSSILVLDHNGFDAYRQGRELADAETSDYLTWADQITQRFPTALTTIPDVIGDDEQNNLSRICEALFLIPNAISRGLPVWHLGDSEEQLDELLELGFQNIGIGSHPAFPIQHQAQAHERIAFALDRASRFNVSAHLLCGLTQDDMERRSNRPLTTSDYLPDFHYIVDAEKPKAQPQVLAMAA